MSSFTGTLAWVAVWLIACGAGLAIWCGLRRLVSEIAEMGEGD